MAEIRFVNASKRFEGSDEVISNLNLTVNQGEFMVLVGPSGCAKSTTLRMTAGLESITSGDLYIGGARVNDLSPAERNISMVFQSYALFPNMTVEDNLSFGLKVRKVNRGSIASEVNRIAEMLGLDELLGRKPRQLSGGQAQRVALGRAMIRRPVAFLFDEPLSNLDAELRVQMRGEISRMQRQLATTTVYVTHDQVEAMTMGDRIAVMNCGRILQVGEPIELYERPANVFVAGFIGSPRMNLLPAADLLRLAGETVAGQWQNTGRDVTLGIRPEDVSIAEDKGKSALAGNGRVARIEDLGHELLVHLELTGSIRLTARISIENRGIIADGASVPVSIRADRLHSFDKETGARF